MIRPIESQPDGWIGLSLTFVRVCSQSGVTQNNPIEFVIKLVTRQPEPGHLSFFFFQVIVETTSFQFETILILEITISFLSRSRSTPPLRSPTSPSFLLLTISLSVSHSLTFYTVARQRPTYLSFLPLVMALCYCHLLCCHLQSRS